MSRRTPVLVANIRLDREQELCSSGVSVSDMSDEPSMSVAAAAEHARENPHDASMAIQTLFDYVEAGGDDASSAAMSLSVVASRAPAAFDGQTDRLERALKTADNVHARRELAETVNNLINQQAIPPRDAGPALSEVMRVREDHAYWETRPSSGLVIIQDGLEGWTNLAAMGEPVPEDVVEQAIGLTQTKDYNTIICIIDLLQAAVESGSPGTDTAFHGLTDIVGADDATVTSEATIAIAELVLNDDIPDKDTAREIITANVDSVRREKQLVEQARKVLAS
jgi:hypothetical protein